MTERGTGTLTGVGKLELFWQWWRPAETPTAVVVLPVWVRHAAGLLAGGLMTYASVSTGFKGGGVNPRPFYPNQANAFNPADVNHDGKIDLNDALIVDKFAGQSYNDQVAQEQAEDLRCEPNTHSPPSSDRKT